ncbi:DUF2271 domain-containing protein [Bacteroides caecigallinarum]|uniref:DUF2271 domain-containing protein n=1 Tax=Bacteroides caecigallinarum TaxID=1411144 RepID=UPI0019571AC9|nr:DUF2271 domain-containing protein [Bacteroides caecigallinarum]MBM6865491.1 DUF2271 domain-containing protein [Bacteroides caecigallinarum]
MRTGLFYAILVAASACLQCCTISYAKDREETKKNSTGERLEISFRFQRGGIASSQYAIWIEDENGNLVRTLYVTSFTANGGYEYRKDAVPVWVNKAKPQKLSYAQIDAITGATPRNGVLTYQWNGTNDKGNPVSPGSYKFFVEGTLYWKNRIMYSGEFVWGGSGQDSISMEVQHFNQSKVNENMITELKAFHIKN